MGAHIIDEKTQEAAIYLLYSVSPSHDGCLESAMADEEGMFNRITTQQAADLYLTFSRAAVAHFCQPQLQLNSTAFDNSRSTESFRANLSVDFLFF